jgi:ATP-dependent DNA helicase RecG
MSATPIPRTLMLTIFGDLDISTITELPSGRKKIATSIVSPAEREEAYELIRKEVAKGRQAFVICPRIENDPSATRASEAALAPSRGNNYAPQPRFSSFAPNPYHLRQPEEIKSVKEEYEKLSQKIFPNLAVAMLHGQMKPKEKEKIMREFHDGKVDVLVSTSVVEVGVDVPNATVMAIEGSDRFGLAQLYQLRGRVGRSEHESHCLLFSESGAKATSARLKAIIEAKNGFELAEQDLKIRGPGEFLGEAQTGIPDIAMEALQDISLIHTSREAAKHILREDPLLARHPLLAERLAKFERATHQE